MATSTVGGKVLSNATDASQSEVLKTAMSVVAYIRCAYGVGIVQASPWGDVLLQEILLRGGNYGGFVTGYAVVVVVVDDDVYGDVFL